MSAPPAARAWPREGSLMAGRIRAHVWARTPLGPIEHWPQSLRTAVDIMLASPVPTSVIWGPEHIQLYNDAYIAIAQARHPACLGQPALETWDEARGLLGPIFEGILAGGPSVVVDNQRIPLRRADGTGVEERAFLATFSAIADERGGVGGIFHPLQETTTAVQALEALRASETRERVLLELGDALRPLADPVEIQATATRVLGEHLAADRVMYGAVEGEDDEAFVIHRDYLRGDMPSAAGRHRFDDFGAYMASGLRAGRTLVTADVGTMLEHTAWDRVRYDAVAIRAYVAVPLVKAGRIAGYLAANQRVPRAWTPDEVALIEEVAERTWAAVERARAEAALRASESKYRTLFETMDEGFCIVQMIFDEDERPVDYRFLEANPAFVQQSGLENAIGRTMRELHPEHEQHWYETYGGVALTGEPVRYENFAESMGRWFDVYAFRIGHPAARQVAVLFSDITERRRQEAALRESWARMVRVFELSPSFLAVLQGPAHVFTLTNPAYHQLIGHRPVVGRPVREAIPEVEGQGFLELLDQVYRTGEPFVGNELPIQLQRTPGAEREQCYVNFVYQPMRDAGGAVTGILASGVDVTALVETRQAVEQTLMEAKDLATQRDAERQRLLAVLEQTPLAIGILEPSGAINFRNPAFDKIWGHPPVDLPAERYNEAYTGYHLDGRPVASHEWPAARAVRGEAAEDEVFHIVQPGGRQLRVWINAGPVRDARGQVTGVVVITRDVTAEHALEQELRASQRLQAVGTLAGGVAHEINNQMTAVLGFGEFVLRALGPDHPQAGDMRLVLNSAERAARISQQLLAFTRQQVTRPAVLELPELVAELTPVLRQLLGSDKTLVTPPSPTALPPVSADRDQVEQVLINLVANARDATDTGARVTITLAEVTVPAELPAPPGDPVAPGRYVRLAVTDTGHGMSAATLERIFDPFFTTKDVGQGTGLGLSMVYGTLRRHGGYVRAQSAPGLGTTMELYWPVGATGARGDGQKGTGPDGTAGVDGTSRTSAATPAPRTVVLVVEDEPLVRTLAARVLADDGHEVAEAADGAAALAMLERGEVQPDLVVTDVVMPHLNGRQLHDAVRTRWPDLPVLYISGHTGEAAVRERLVPVGAAFLGKPFTPAALQRAARELLRASTRTGGSPD